MQYLVASDLHYEFRQLDWITDQAAQFASQLMGDARRHRTCGDAARLGAGDPLAWPRCL